MAVLLVKLDKQVEVVIVYTTTSFDRVELLTSGSEVKALLQRHVRCDPYIIIDNSHV